MTKKEKFNVAVAVFEAFLKRVNANTLYFKEWEEQNEYKGTTNVFYAWREWAKRWHPYLWISSAFTWNETDQGLNFWHTRHCMWKRYLKDNLNN